MKLSIPYRPSPKQTMFHASVADEILYGGAAGGGKTKAIIMDALFRCLKHPGTTAAVFRRTYRELDDTDIKEATASYPKQLVTYSQARREFTLMNGSKILFRHCENPADRFNYSGIEVQFLYFDELTSFEKEIYDFLKTRLRAKKSLGVRPIVRSASNPGNIGHGWVKSYFVDAAPYMEIVRHEVFSETLQRKQVTRTQYIPSLASENPHITDDYIFQLERKPKALRDALLNGDWNAFEGQVFSEWRDDPEHYIDQRWTHVIEPFEIPIWWPRMMGFDHGYTKPFAVAWYAVSPDDTLIMYREWYGCRPGEPNVGIELTPSQIAAGILEREKDEINNNITIDRIADPAIFDSSRGPSVAEQMQPDLNRPGVIFRRGENKRIPGWNQLHERLRFDVNGKTRLQVFRTCSDTIRTFPNLPYTQNTSDAKKAEDVDTRAEDHLADQLRYVAMARPVAPTAPARPRQYQKYDPLNMRGEYDED